MGDLLLNQDSSSTSARTLHLQPCLLPDVRVPTYSCGALQETCKAVERPGANPGLRTEPQLSLVRALTGTPGTAPTLTYFLQRSAEFLAHRSISHEASLGSSHLHPSPKTWRERDPSGSHKAAMVLTHSSHTWWLPRLQVFHQQQRAHQSAPRVYISTLAKVTRAGFQILVFLLVPVRLEKNQVHRS